MSKHTNQAGMAVLPLDDPARLARLTPQQQWVAVRLQTDPVEDVADEMGLSPDEFRQRHLEPIRRLLSAE
jgi:hypothetical protein